MIDSFTRNSNQNPQYSIYRFSTWNWTRDNNNSYHVTNHKSSQNNTCVLLPYWPSISATDFLTIWDSSSLKKSGEKYRLKKDTSFGFKIHIWYETYYLNQNFKKANFSSIKFIGHQTQKFYGYKNRIVFKWGFKLPVGFEQEISICKPLQNTTIRLHDLKEQSIYIRWYDVKAYLPLRTRYQLVQTQRR